MKIFKQADGTYKDEQGNVVEVDAATNPAQIAQNIIARHNGDASVAVGVLAGENFQLRDKVRQQNERITALEGGQPKDGALVLSKADAERWEAYKKLGTPEEVTTKIADGDKASGELQSIRAGSAISDAARDLNLNAAALQRLVKLDGITVEKRTVKENGQDVERYFAKYKGDDGKDAEKALTDYRQERWQEFNDILGAPNATSTDSQNAGAAAAGAGAQGAAGTQTGGNRVVPFVPQGGSQGAQGGNLFDKIRANTKAEQDAKKTDVVPLEKRLGMA